MGVQELIQRCHNTGYKKLTGGKKSMGMPRRCRTLKKINGRLKGFKLISTRKLKWRSFWIALMPKRTLRICCDILNRLKVDGAYPAIVFSSQWGLPVLSHPTSKCRNPIVSCYKKPGNINHVVFA
ncbi:hypothetical protein L2E82_01536 [Cichorium intybus]|uniref:Uncharacterized protein n=1 Tax=Cichorium intybus TaxID=13427 RepID=A0ACB9H094_CICIN|nr:hypothetical protein L2E82_01536 [Cichorium intybus]